MNPFREAPVKIKYTMSKEEIIEACQEWLENNKDLSMEESQDLQLVYHDGTVVTSVEAVLEIEE